MRTDKTSQTISRDGAPAAIFRHPEKKIKKEKILQRRTDAASLWLLLTPGLTPQLVYNSIYRDDSSSGLCGTLEDASSTTRSGAAGLRACFDIPPRPAPPHPAPPACLQTPGALLLQRHTFHLLEGNFVADWKLNHLHSPRPSRHVSGSALQVRCV